MKKNEVLDETLMHMNEFLIGPVTRHLAKPNASDYTFSAVIRLKDGKHEQVSVYFNGELVGQFPDEE